MPFKIDPKLSKTVVYISKVFSLFSMDTEEIGVRETSRLLGLYPSNASRLLSSLEYCGFLERTQNGRYKIGMNIFEVGSLYPFHLPVIKIVRPHAEELARIFGVGVHFAILRQAPPYSAIIVDRILNSQSPSLLVQRLTLNVPLRSSGVGKASFF